MSFGDFQPVSETSWVPDCLFWSNLVNVPFWTKKSEIQSRGMAMLEEQWVLDTPRKINMEPTNHPFGKENDLNQTSRELCSMLIYRGHNQPPPFQSIMGWKSIRKFMTPQKKEDGSRRLWVVQLWVTRWWFEIFFIFTPIWGRFPIWLIFFRWVGTTNQVMFGLVSPQNRFWYIRPIITLPSRKTEVFSWPHVFQVLHTVLGVLLTVYVYIWWYHYAIHILSKVDLETCIKGRFLDFHISDAKNRKKQGQGYLFKVARSQRLSPALDKGCMPWLAKSFGKIRKACNLGLLQYYESRLDRECTYTRWFNPWPFHPRSLEVT